MDLFLKGFFLSVFVFLGFIVNVGKKGFDGGDLRRISENEVREFLRIMNKKFIDFFC
jgi:hypothetical protein